VSVRGRAEFWLFFITLVWGGSFIAVKFGLRESTPVFFLFLRFGGATIVYLPIFLKIIKYLNRANLRHGVILGSMVFFAIVLQTIGLKYTSASRSGFVTELLVVFTAVFQLLIHKRALERANMVGIPLVILGLYFLTDPDAQELNRGDWMTLGCAIIYGLYLVFLDSYAKIHDIQILTFVQMAVTTILAGAGAFLFEDVRFTGGNTVYLSLLYLIPLATILPMYIQTRFQKDTTPARAAVIFVLEPVFAAIFAGWILEERLGKTGILGGALIVIGLVISELPDVLLPKPLRKKFR